MSEKVRRIDYYPDEYIAGVGNVLTAAEQGVFWIVCSLIMSEGGPIRENHMRIGGLCCLRPAEARKIIDRLVDVHGKLARSDGKLCQKRAQSEVELAAKRIQSARENGAKGGRPAAKTQENQQNAEPDGSSAEKLTTNYQPPTTNDHKKDSEAIASDAPASPPPEPPTVAEQVWRTVLPWLAEHSGKKESALRSMVGKWCRDYGEPAVLGAFMEAARSPPVDPVAWFQRRLAGRKQTGSPLMDAFDELDERIRDAGFAAH